MEMICGIDSSFMVRLPKWWLRECLPDMSGTRKMKYPGLYLALTSSKVDTIAELKKNDVGMFHEKTLPR